MSVRKYAAVIMGVLLLCTACGRDAPDLERHAYTEEEKVQLSSSIQTSFVYIPSLEANCILSDLVIEGIILEGAETKNAYPFADSGTSKSSFAIPYTDIPVWVDNVLYGDTSEDVITLRMVGDMTSSVTKPQPGDHLILFLGYGEDLDVYNTCCSEDSIFINNPPDNTVFTFTNMPTITKFDGEPFDSFKQEIGETYETLREYLTEHPDAYSIRGTILDDLLGE